MASERLENWYVKASFGAEWGPMSSDTLLEMADNGDLARDDMTRSDEAADWQPIQTVIDQLRTAPFADYDEEAAAEELPTADDSFTLPSEGVATLEPAPHFSEQPAPIKRRGGALPGWSNYWVPDSANSTESRPLVAHPRLVLEDQFQSHHVAPSETTVEGTSFRLVSEKAIEGSSEDSREVPSAADAISGTMPADGDFAMLNSWKQERKERLDRLLKIVADREAAAREAALAQAESANNAASQETATAEDDSEVATKEPIETPRKQFSPPPESWKLTLDRWKRSLPDPKAALVLLIVPLAAWWFWPESSGNAGRTFRAMYDELRELRERPNDKTGMAEFVQRSQAKLDQLIPVLEKRASPNRPESQWLLWMGKDCLRPMLKNPRLNSSKPELNFKKLLAEWERLNGLTTETNSEDESGPPANREPSTDTAPDSSLSPKIKAKPQPVETNDAN